MTGYSQYDYWSPILGANAARLSMFNAQGQEFFMIIEVPDSTKQLRAAREDALDAISEAIALGLQPGEVKVMT